MKRISRKALSLLLAVLLVVTLCVPTLAASKKDEANPVLIITGFNFYSLGYDTQTDALPRDAGAIAGIVAEVMPSLATFLASGRTQEDYDAFCDAVLPVVTRMFDPVSCNPDGTVKHPEVGSKIQLTEALGNYPDEVLKQVDAYDADLMQSVADDIGGDKVYMYCLDWRLDPMDVADEINDWVQHIKSVHGCDKVSLAGISMGGVILSAYLAKYGTDDVSNVTMISAAFTGLEYIGAMFNGGIEVDPQGLYNLITQVVGRDTLSKILGATRLIEQVLPIVDDLLEHSGDRIYAEALCPAFGFNPGIWSFVPANMYEDAKAFMFERMISTEQEKAVLEAKLDAYHEVQANARETLQAAKAAGVNVAIISNYNLQMPPVSTVSDLTGDQVIEAMHTSAYGTFAKQGGTLPDSVQGKYVSPDHMVDASTCYMPDETWFIKNMGHVSFSDEQNQCKLYTWLMTTKEQVTVETRADYPQFLVYNADTKILSPLGLTRGDVNFDGVIDLVDARLALRHAQGLITLPAVEREAADMNGDNKVTTADAQMILNICAGLSETPSSSSGGILDSIKDKVSGVLGGDSSSSDAGDVMGSLGDRLGGIGDSLGGLFGSLQTGANTLAENAQSKFPSISLPKSQEQEPEDAAEITQSPEEAVEEPAA